MCCACSLVSVVCAEFAAASGFQVAESASAAFERDASSNDEPVAELQPMELDGNEVCVLIDYSMTAD